MLRNVLGLTPGQRFIKRAFDITCTLAIVALFWWLLLVVAIGVRLTTGAPVIFGHARIGRNGRPFMCLKFRSMVPNAEEVLKQLLATDEQARAEWAKDFKLKNDPRVTRFGHFLRRTSLDELPQLWNVLRGDMSIVGPRPVVERELELYYVGAQSHYKAVRPGLTGLWQVSGRNDLNYDQRVALDQQYVENWGLWLDLVTVVRTVGVVFGRKGAY